jgi:hypothetical protein
MGVQSGLGLPSYLCIGYDVGTLNLIRDSLPVLAKLQRRRRGHRLAQHGPRRACALKGQVLGKRKEEIIPRCRRPARSGAECLADGTITAVTYEKASEGK